jgi:hypothetical protein
MEQSLQIATKTTLNNTQQTKTIINRNKIAMQMTTMLIPVITIITTTATISNDKTTTINNHTKQPQLQ